MGTSHLDSAHQQSMHTLNMMLKNALTAIGFEKPHTRIKHRNHIHPVLQKRTANPCKPNQVLINPKPNQRTSNQSRTQSNSQQKKTILQTSSWARIHTAKTSRQGGKHHMKLCCMCAPPRGCLHSVWCRSFRHWPSYFSPFGYTNEPCPCMCPS